jgi:hypothetical protein
MIKEALEYLTKLQTPLHPVTVEVEKQPYAVRADGTIGEPICKIDSRFIPTPLLTTTLSGLVEAYKAKYDKLGDRVAFQIASPFEVTLCDLDSDDYGKQRIYAIAKHVEEKPFKFDAYWESEAFLIVFRQGFLFTEDAAKVAQLCSTLTSSNAVGVADDGISQEVTTKAGTVTKTSVVLPADGVPLVPWRTFRDANPVQSKFLLRMKGVKDAVPHIALFEIDAMWKLDTIASIRKYLNDSLPEAIVIA